MKKERTPFRVGILGPPASFTEIAAKSVLPDEVLVHTNTISEIVQAVSSSKVDFGILPLENLIHGPVTETLDALTEIYLENSIQNENFAPSIAPSIAYSFNIPIEHFIGVPKQFSDIPLDKIEEVYSHPQALAQSEKFLKEHLPNAKRVSVSSTSIAPANALSASLPAAAISSKNALIAENFHIHGETVSREKQNKTRFGIIALPSSLQKLGSLLESKEKETSPYVTSLCLHPGKDRKGLLLELLSIISEKHSCNMLSINSRPDTEGGFIFYFDIEGGVHDQKVSECIKSLEEYCKVQTGSSARLFTFGSYQRKTFKEPLITSVAVIGAKGSMGKWLCQFFSDSGLAVTQIDLDSNEEEKKKITSSNVVFFSVPMRNLEEIAKDLSPYIAEGTLLVENCSVKTKALHTLQNIFDERFETLGVHTMFGPDIKELKGKNIIITKTPASGEKAKTLENIFYKHGANIHHATIDEHDSATAFLQALCQFYAMGMAEALQQLNPETLSSIKHFITPNSERALFSVQRLLLQSPLLTEDLQTENPHATNARKKFIENLRNIDSETNTESALEEHIKQLHEKLGPLLEKILTS